MLRRNGRKYHGMIVKQGKYLGERKVDVAA